MSNDVEARRAARPHGVVSQGCRGCVHFEVCGGIEPDAALFDCFDHYCCGGKSGCDEVCPYNSTFHWRMHEVGGLQFRDVGPIAQHEMDLPRYIPLIHHGYSRRHLLELPVVALDTYQVFRIRDGKYRALAADGAVLRKEFGLSPETRIVLRGTARDRRLEQYWSYRRIHGVAEQMKKLEILLAIGPNFSHFLDVPRTDNLFNRRRQLICVREMCEAGLFAVPHLSAVTPADWRFWQSFLRESPSVKFVAIEFQTGNKNPVEGRSVIERVSALQDAAGRRLHPVVIGGTQFAQDVAARFDSFSFIDSCPFMKALKRQEFERATAGRAWVDGFTLRDQGVEDILLRNLKGHAGWIDEECSKVTLRKEVAPMT